jgi:serine phosphatase RsbU (regulator of sigma subunit)
MSDQEPQKPAPRRGLRLLLAVVAVLVLGTLLALAKLPVISTLAKLGVAGGLGLLLLWGGWRLYQAVLWKVGRRLAFSYLLIGVLPIPLVLLLLSAVSYILTGYFLGHLFRDAARTEATEMAMQAERRLAAVAGSETGGAETVVDGIAFATYRKGKRREGDERLPETWPAWVAEAQQESADAALPTFFALDGGAPTLAVTAGDGSADGDLGVLAVYVGDLAQELSERSDVWVRLLGPAAEEDVEGRVNVEVMGTEMALKTDPRRSPGAAEAFFAARSRTTADSSWWERWWDRPFLWWGEAPGPLPALADGTTVADRFGVGLNAPPRIARQRYFAGSAELDVSVWSSLFVFAFLLFDVYAAAALMAAVMIFALTRAVNRLSTATEAVRGGDFSVRIPVRRRDQVGALQRSFNTMAENLEQLVATATQKELLEKELAIARDLQQSLIPRDLPSPDGIEFATVFEPSAAIGGDYFDILRLGEDRLAVIVADVSGHGLPTGLRMAMMKSALTILVSQAKPVDEILSALDTVARIDEEGRFFVTATLALLDFRGGLLELTNAGHPPTYLLHDGGVREILLPGSPLGSLGREWGRERVMLAEGDVVVWLSDGFIESCNADDEPFGYHGIEATLAAVAEQAAGDGRELRATEVRDRLVAAVAEHTAGRRVEDDRTLVVMRYRSAADVAPSAASDAASAASSDTPSDA